MPKCYKVQCKNCGATGNAGDVCEYCGAPLPLQARSNTKPIIPNSFPKPQPFPKEKPVSKPKSSPYIASKDKSTYTSSSSSDNGNGCFSVMFVVALCVGAFWLFFPTEFFETYYGLKHKIAYTIDTQFQDSTEMKRIMELKQRDSVECEKIIYQITHELINIYTFSGGKSCKLRKTPVSYKEYDAVVNGYFSDDAERYAPIENGYSLFKQSDIEEFFKCLNEKTGGNYRVMTFQEQLDVMDNIGMFHKYDEKRRETHLVFAEGSEYYASEESFHSLSTSYYFRIAADWD